VCVREEKGFGFTHKPRAYIYSITTRGQRTAPSKTNHEYTTIINLEPTSY
jgi:hypothetical protein